jgi:outer membrane receptor protein involved in Fe transport
VIFSADLMKLTTLFNHTTMTQRYIATIALVGASFLGGVRASGQPTHNPQADTLMIQREQVTITAERSFSAVSNSEYRAADFALRPRNSAQDILRVVPGLVVAQHAGGGKAEQIFLRGFDCDHGTDINISVDGAPVNMVSHGHGQGYADLHFIIPETIERVEVVKGPYFARFGDLTTAGAVTFATKDSLTENLVKVEGGRFNTYRAMALLRTPSGNTGIAAYVGGEIFRSDGYFQAPQNYTRVNIFGKVHASLGEGSSLTGSMATFNSVWDASGQLPDRAVRSGEISRFGTIDSLEGGITSRTTATMTFATGGASPLSITGSYTDYRFRLYSNFTFFLRDSLRGDMIEQTDQRSVITLKGERTFSWMLGDNPAKTTFGINLRNDDILAALYHDSTRVRLETTRNNRIVERQTGGYMEQELVLPWVSLLLGVRADYLSFDVENLLQSGTPPEGIDQQLIVSPKANLSIPLSDDVSLFLNSGFGFHSNDARVVVANTMHPTLPRAFGAEIGMRYGSPRSTVAASAAAWVLDLESEFVYVGDEGTTEPSGRTRRTGIDFEAHINPLDWLALGVDATVSHGRLRDEPDGSNSIPLAPSVTLSANALFRLDPFTAALRLRMVDNRPANTSNSVVATGYQIVDLSASYRVGQVDFFANIENLLNQQWNEAQFDTESRLRNESEPVSELHFTPGTPISIRGGVALHF